jgi:AraC-like DNA-binding protein
MAGLQVDLTPLGARMALGVPMHELARRSVELEDVIGGEARTLADRLHATPSWDERIDLVTRALERRLRDAAAPPPDVAWAWSRLEETDGRTRISELAATLGCSGKHLAARFREYVGLPPKLVARTMRFRRAARLLADHPLDEVAYACGYYDQAHLDRDFREFAGTTPTVYRRDPRAVTFFQDS